MDGEVRLGEALRRWGEAGEWVWVGILCMYCMEGDGRARIARIGLGAEMGARREW